MKHAHRAQWYEGPLSDYGWIAVIALAFLWIMWPFLRWLAGLLLVAVGL